ncbi:MAG: hypothetical protein ABI693_12210 [Bryobacteraceae bacterium]
MKHAAHQIGEHPGGDAFPRDRVRPWSVFTALKYPGRPAGDGIADGN